MKSVCFVFLVLITPKATADWQNVPKSRDCHLGSFFPCFTVQKLGVNEYAMNCLPEKAIYRSMKSTVEGRIMNPWLRFTEYRKVQMDNGFDREVAVFDECVAPSSRQESSKATDGTFSEKQNL